MGHCAHQTPILYDGAATHPLHDAARLGQKGRVCDPKDHVPLGVGVADPLDLDPVGPRRPARHGRPDLGTAGLDLLRKGNFHRLPGERGAGGAVDPVFSVDADAADGPAAQEAALQLAGTARRAFAASGDLTGDDLPAAQRNAFAGVAVADGVAQPRKGAPLLIRKGQRADPCRGVPHPHSCPPLARRLIPDGRQARLQLLSVSDIDHLHSVPLRRFQRRLDRVVVLRRRCTDPDDPVSKAQPGPLGGVRRAAAGLFHIREADDQRPFRKHLDAERRPADGHLPTLHDDGADGLDG